MNIKNFLIENQNLIDDITTKEYKNNKLIKQEHILTIKQEYKTYKTYANRGMGLENDISLSNEFYLNNDIAVIYKKPTPITIAKVDYPSRLEAVIKEGYFKTPSTTDYNGIYKGKYIDFPTSYKYPNEYLMKKIKLTKDINADYRLTIYDDFYTNGYIIENFSENKSSINIINKNKF